MVEDFNIMEFSLKNRARSREKFGKAVSVENIPYFIIALVGEVGEFANAYKKLVRKVDPGTGRDFKTITKKILADELADIQIYLDLLATSCDVDLAEALAEKFNEVSDNLDSPIKIK